MSAAPYGWTAIHIKTGNEYTVVGEATNATNAQDGQHLVIYERDGQMFARDAAEFVEKFCAKEAEANKIIEQTTGVMAIEEK